ncbi:hypothetical protein F3Y22_tig00111952pilonHSYRG00084 [Hibiscus syriacus]|uniref:Uncharacterized protein n=1 Tax=Hibiscus syriacus TaxID=106335 RepID=A0A6A2YDA4_HIBSY|nr:hypothetical protein F3Y22_tig00111952pilonHSYRG00084 [Hibiscus syriacus]
MKILRKIQVSGINTTFDRFLMFLIRKESNDSPKKRSNTSPANSPTKVCRLMMNSPGGDIVSIASTSAPVTPTRSFSANAGWRQRSIKKDRTTSVKCLFVRFESHASIDEGKAYVLSGKTVKEARSMFMHVPYPTKHGQVYGQYKDGSYVLDKDGKHRIHTDGTGYLSEDLALKCPRNVYKGSIAGGVNVEIGPIFALTVC